MVNLGNSSDLTLSDGKISKNNYYLKISDSNKVETQRRQNTVFTFYPLETRTVEEKGEGGMFKDFTIPLQTIVDGVAEQTHIIRRNDFIDVLVTVSYNENTGKIDFHVEDWSKKEGNVEFN